MAGSRLMNAPSADYYAAIRGSGGGGGFGGSSSSGVNVTAPDPSLQPAADFANMTAGAFPFRSFSDLMTGVPTPQNVAQGSQAAWQQLLADPNLGIPTTDMVNRVQGSMGGIFSGMMKDAMERAQQANAQAGYAPVGGTQQAAEALATTPTAQAEFDLLSKIAAGRAGAGQAAASQYGQTFGDLARNQQSIYGQIEGARQQGLGRAMSNAILAKPGGASVTPNAAAVTGAPGTGGAGGGGGSGQQPGKQQQQSGQQQQQTPAAGTGGGESSLLTNPVTGVGTTEWNTSQPVETWDQLAGIQSGRGGMLPDTQAQFQDFSPSTGTGQYERPYGWWNQGTALGEGGA